MNKKERAAINAVLAAHVAATTEAYTLKNRIKAGTLNCGKLEGRKLEARDLQTDIIALVGSDETPKFATTVCTDCNQTIVYESVSTHGSTWETLTLNGRNVAVAYSGEGSEQGKYATCAHCSLEMARARLVRVGGEKVAAL